MAIDRTVPSERNNTYVPSEVSRRTAEELFEIAFNEDQKKALLSLLSGDSEDTPAIPAPTTADNGKVLGVDGGEYALTEVSSGTEVETIKLATIQGSLSTLTSGTTGLKWLTGGGNAIDGKTVAELIGDKTIIGLTCNTRGENVYGIDANVNGTKLVGANSTTLGTGSAITVNMLVQGTSTSHDLYAICI